MAVLLSATRAQLLAYAVVVASQVVGCSPEPGVDSDVGSAGSTAGVPSPVAGAPTSVAGSSGAAPMGGAGGAATNVMSGAAGQSAPAGGAGGVATGGVAGASGSAGSGGSGGDPGPTPQCNELVAAYASALAEQVTCSSGAANQCGSLAEAAPGCDCHVFIQPKDPFAIEHLLNLQADWFDADCEDPQCPVDCPDGDNGTCAQGKCVPG